MIELERLAAFALVTGMTSLVPGPSMLFVLSQSIWRGARSGVAALAGLPAMRRRLDIAVGAIFILIALGILAELFLRSGSA